MKRKTINNLLLLVLSGIVFLTGAGITIVDYCCSECRMKMFSMNSIECCSMDNHITQKLESTCCKLNKDLTETSCKKYIEDFSSEQCCSTSRISVDIDSSIFRPQINIPFIWISDYIYKNQFPLKCEGNYTRIFESNTDILKPPPPRHYLSFIQVLII